ncbi:MAG: histidine phosphatase family protein [Chloroflexi bacterium]|nr:histidine phosphatase family protein [Chloroflexota bacterium]
MKLLLVRHGETEWNKLGKFQGQSDISLNLRGMDQARETAQALASDQYVALYSSPLCRTMQVADEIARVIETPVVPVRGLMEWDLGDLEGVTGAEMRADWPEVYASWRKDPGTTVMPNGESLAQLQKRAWQAVLHLEQAHSEDDVVVAVSHNFAIRTIVGKLLGMPLSNFHRMVLNLASICTIETETRGWRLVSYNSTGHLSPENR